ncbi:hypothetical protein CAUPRSCDRAFT_12918 [Caulochytrium protostelioides]|nr:hypothetical protein CAUPRSCDRAFT_12918 [Caulochytrium protostelioides]
MEVLSGILHVIVGTGVRSAAATSASAPASPSSSPATASASVSAHAPAPARAVPSTTTTQASHSTDAGVSSPSPVRESPRRTHPRPIPQIVIPGVEPDSPAQPTEPSTGMPVVAPTAASPAARPEAPAVVGPDADAATPSRAVAVAPVPDLAADVLAATYDADAPPLPSSTT